MKKMRKIYDSKVFWLVLSFLISLSVWVYVTSVETVQSTKVFRNVRVEIVGEETLLSTRDMVITDVDTNTVTVEIRGPRRVVNALDSEDLVAEVDVSKLGQAAYTSLNYTIVYPSGTDKRSLTVVSRSRDTINFMVSKLTTKQIPVQGGFEGKVGNGYAETPIFEPSVITVTGPEAYLRNIHHAYVTFGADQTVDNTYSVETGFELQDANNEICPTAEISYEPLTIQATLPILALKEVPLNVGLLEGGGASEANTKVNIEPKYITLAGDSAILSEINQIFLDTIDLGEFLSDYTASYSIPIPNGVRNITGATEATVNLQIVGLETKTFYISNFTWIGLDEMYEALPISSSIPVVLRGRASTLNLITTDNIRAEVDLSSLSGKVGNYVLPVKVTIPNYSTVGPISVNGEPDYTVAVTIERKSDT